MSERTIAGATKAEVGESAFPMPLALHVFDEMAMTTFGSNVTTL